MHNWQSPLELCPKLLLRIQTLLLTGLRDLPTRVLRGPHCAPRTGDSGSETKQK